MSNTALRKGRPTPAVGVALGLALAAAILAACPMLATAGEINLKPSHGPDIGTVGEGTAQSAPAGDPARPAHPRLRPSYQIVVSRQDQAYALERLQIALSEVADGSNYVWHRQLSGLGGIIRPVRSYYNDRNDICREFEMLLTAHDKKRETIASACRNAHGVWRVEGGQQPVDHTALLSG